SALRALRLCLRLLGQTSRDAVENHSQPPKRKGRQVKRSNFLGDLGGKILISGFSTDFLAGC
ncbi:MAG: hypothetical protein AABZ02_11810, partial [Bacteroidota bacterium]